MLKTITTPITALAIAATTTLASTLSVLAQPISSPPNNKDLIQTIYCPGAIDEYGSYNEWGYWEGGDTICGGTYALEGYWVYDAPYWYVYDEAIAGYGAYEGWVQTLRCDEDVSTYGSYYDYGYWGGGSWCGDYGAEGYWVYVAPNWYIWDR